MLLLKMLKVKLLWRVRSPQDISFYLVSVITLNHIKKWFSMHFLKFLVWFLMLRASLIGFLILGNHAPHGMLSLCGDWEVLCTNPLFHGCASVTKSVGKCCRKASSAETFCENNVLLSSPWNCPPLRQLGKNGVQWAVCFWFLCFNTRLVSSVCF